MTNELTQRLDEAWHPLRDAVERIGLDGLSRKTSAGWTVKEMLGHVAFWDECVEPVVIGILRGDAERMGGWPFGSGYTAPTDGEWPHFDVHNAREAEWASTQSADAVLARLDAAHAAAIAATEKFTPEEVADEKFVKYVDDCAGHYREHLGELDSLA